MKAIVATVMMIAMGSIAHAEHFCRCELGRAGNPIFYGETIQEARANAESFCGLSNVVTCFERDENNCSVGRNPDPDRYGRE